MVGVVVGVGVGVGVVVAVAVVVVVVVVVVVGVGVGVAVVVGVGVGVVSFRTENLYVQRKTKKRLWDVLSIYPVTFTPELKFCRSADELADYLINAMIDERYPEEKRLRDTKAKAEQESAMRIREEMPELEVEHRE